MVSLTDLLTGQQTGQGSSLSSLITPERTEPVRGRTVMEELGLSERDLQPLGQQEAQTPEGQAIQDRVSGRRNVRVLDDILGQGTPQVQERRRERLGIAETIDLKDIPGIEQGGTKKMAQAIKTHLENLPSYAQRVTGLEESVLASASQASKISDRFHAIADSYKKSQPKKSSALSGILGASVLSKKPKFSEVFNDIADQMDEVWGKEASIGKTIHETLFDFGRDMSSLGSGISQAIGSWLEGTAIKADQSAREAKEKGKPDPFRNESRARSLRMIADPFLNVADQLQLDDPDFLEKIAQMTGSGIAYYIPAAGMMKGPQLIEKGGKFLRFAKRMASPGVGLMSVMEGLAESAGVHDEILRRGGTKIEAEEAAEFTAATNILILSPLNALGLGSEQRSAIKRIFLSSPSEGIQEGFQGAITNYALGARTFEEIWEGFWSNVGFGLSVGIIMGGVTGKFSNPKRVSSMQEGNPVDEEIMDIIIQRGQRDGFIREGRVLNLKPKEQRRAPEREGREAQLTGPDRARRENKPDHPVNKKEAREFVEGLFQQQKDFDNQISEGQELDPEVDAAQTQAANLIELLTNPKVAKAVQKITKKGKIQSIKGKAPSEINKLLEQTRDQTDSQSVARAINEFFKRGITQGTETADPFVFEKHLGDLLEQKETRRKPVSQKKIRTNEELVDFLKSEPFGQKLSDEALQGATGQDLIDILTGVEPKSVQAKREQRASDARLEETISPQQEAEMDRFRESLPQDIQDAMEQNKPLNRTQLLEKRKAIKEQIPEGATRDKLLAQVNEDLRKGESPTVAAMRKASEAEKRAIRAEKKSEKETVQLKKLQSQLKKITQRRGKVSAIRDFFHLTDIQIVKIGGKKDTRLMSDKEFDTFIEKISTFAQEESERMQKATIIQAEIKAKELIKTENLRKALALPPITKMNTKQLDTFFEAVSSAQPKDIFLTQRQLETLKNTNMEGKMTEREVKEILSKSMNKPVENLVISSKWFDSFNYDTALARSDPFYNLMVTEFNARYLRAEMIYLEAEKKTNALAKSARKSKPKSLKQIIAPTDDLVFEWGGSDNKTSVVEKMTKEELEFGEFVQEDLIKMRDFLIENQGMTKFFTNYMVHVRRSFLETATRDGIAPAMKEIIKQNKEDQAVFNIISDTGNILPLEKFFPHLLHRSGELVPSKNVAKAYLSYKRAFERMRAFNEIMPKFDTYVTVLSPKKMTPRGLEMDKTLKNFYNEWINNKKGRKTSFGGKIPQGGIIDVSLRTLNLVSAIKDLGLAIGFASAGGEQAMTFVSMGPKNFAKGKIRMNTKRGKRIIEKYRNFTGISPWQKMSQAADNLGDKASSGFFIVFHTLSVQANKNFLLGDMTAQEYASETVSPERLAAMQLDMGRWRVVHGHESVVGNTSVARTVTKYKGWTIPILRTSLSNLQKISSNLSLLSQREGQELFRVAIITAAFALVGMSIIDEDDETLLGQTLSKLTRDGMSGLGALNPLLWLAAPRGVTLLADFIVAMAELITVQEYSTTVRGQYKEGDLKGVKHLKDVLTIKIIKELGQITPKKGTSFSDPGMQEKMDKMLRNIGGSSNTTEDIQNKRNKILNSIK